jgi:hypothetical protein
VQTAKSGGAINPVELFRKVKGLAAWCLRGDQSQQEFAEQ